MSFLKFHINDMFVVPALKTWSNRSTPQWIACDPYMIHVQSYHETTLLEEISVERKFHRFCKFWKKLKKVKN